LARAGVAHPISDLAGMVVVAAVRLASIVFGLQLPVFALEGDGVPVRRPSRDRTSES